MPAFAVPRAQAFADAQARGTNPENAHELADLAAGREHASRFAKRPKVPARIGELIAANEPTNRPNKPETARSARIAPPAERAALARGFFGGGVSPRACRSPRLPAQTAIAEGDDA